MMAKLVRRVMLDTGLSREQARDAVDRVWFTLRRAIQDGHTLRFRGFGTFTPAVWRGRAIANQKQQAWFLVPDRQSIRFRAAAALKAMVADRAKELRHE